MQVPFLSYSSKKNTKSLYFDLNLANIDFISLVKEGDIVLFFSALSSPEFCALNPHLANKLNYQGTVFYIKELIKLKAKVIFFSSDVVYGDNKLINDEKSEPKPSGVYANLKYDVEKLFFDSSYFTSLRLSFVFSKFDKFHQYIFNNLNTNSVAEVYKGLNRNIIFLDDLIHFLYVIIKLDSTELKNLPRVINVVGPENLSRFQMSNILSSYFNNFQFKIIDTPSEILNFRPDSIFTKSLYFDKIYTGSLVTYEQFISDLRKD